MELKAPSPPPKLLTPCHATNWMPFIVRPAADGFEIVCRPTPMRAIRGTTIIIAVTFIAFVICFYLVKADPLGYWVIFLIGIPTVFGFHFGTIAFHERQQRRGPLLVYKGVSRSFELPRESVSLSVDQVESCVLICDRTSDEAFWQLQLWTKQADRFPLVTAFTRLELEPMANAIRTGASIPVRVFIDERGKKGIDWQEEPFSPT